MMGGGKYSVFSRFPLNKCECCGKKINEEVTYCPHCGYNITPWELKEGATLHHGRYKIIKPLGEGGMASIYLAEDTNLDDTQCVIKVMLDEFKDAEERTYAIQKFKEEAVVLARLRHTNLPVVQNHFLEEGKYYLVMDFVEGDTLDGILIEALESDCLLPEELVIDWAIQICDVLDYLHHRDPMIIHRDIKPSNLMEREDGTVMLLDFGVARIFDQKKSGTLVGTPGYAAPEQYLGKAFPQSDIYSFGVTLHRLITGYDPSLEEEEEGEEDGSQLFNYPPLEEFRDDLSPGLQDVIGRCVEIEVEARYSSAKKLKEALLKIKEKPEVVAPKKLPHPGQARDSRLRAIDRPKELFLKKEAQPPAEILPPLFPELFKFKPSMSLPEFKNKLSSITAIDIGSYEIRLLKLDVDGNGNIYPQLMAGARTPENAVGSGGIISDPGAVSKTLKNLTKDIKGEFVASMSPYSCSIKTIKIPVTPTEKIASVLGADLKALLHLPVDDCHICYEVLSPAIPGDERNMKIRVTATRKSCYFNLKKSLEMANINSDKIASEPSLLAFLMEQIVQDENRKKNIALINIGSEGTYLSLIKDKILSQTINFNHGGKRITNALMQAERLPFDKADELKKTKCNAEIVWGKTDNVSINLFQTTLPHFKDWSTELLKAMRFFGPEYRLEKFNTIVFSGGGIQLKNLHRHINSQIKIKSDKFSLPRSKECQLSKETIEQKEASLMTCMALAISPFTDFNYFKLEEKKKKGLFDSLFGRK